MTAKLRKENVSRKKGNAQKIINSIKTFHVLIKIPNVACLKVNIKDECENIHLDVQNNCIHEGGLKKKGVVKKLTS